MVLVVGSLGDRQISGVPQVGEKALIHSHSRVLDLGSADMLLAGGSGNGTERLVCLIPAMNTPSPFPPKADDGVRYSAKHLCGLPKRARRLTPPPLTVSSN